MAGWMSSWMAGWMEYKSNLHFYISFLTQSSVFLQFVIFIFLSFFTLLKLQ